MNYLSVCSGIEAASVAWRPLGWHPAGFAEIEAFPSAVLRQHYPAVENRGDMTRFMEWPDAAIDVLVGGTPCQSFSVAGLRKGLDDPRGSLLLVYLAMARRFRPRWLVWENVPGVLSIDDGRAFGSLLGGLALLGYGFAYRILDAQYFRLAQRRRRVFVVGHLGDWRRAAAVLFQRASLSGHPAPRREAREGVAGTLSGSSQSGGFRTTDLDNSGAFIPEIVPQAMSAKWSKGSSGPAGDEVANLVAFNVKDHGADAGDLAPTLRAGTHDKSHANGGVMPAVAYGIRSDAARTGEAKTPSPDAEGRVRLRDAGFNIYEQLAPTVDSSAAHTVAFQESQSGFRATDAHPTLDSHNGSRRHHGALVGMQVRRLTPRECERLQGFPDDYSLVTYRGKPAADGPRYKALGNSMAVPVMRWIGQRIAMVDAL
jgi:DNA (cytosine-5)-methyltransferase 1